MDLNYMISKLPKVKDFYSLPLDSSSYKLFKVSEEIISRFYLLLEKLELQTDTIVCLRGDSKVSFNKHKKFFKYELNKVFVVGGKSNYYFSKEVESLYAHTYTENKDILLLELNNLIDKANKAMNKREEESKSKALNYFRNLDLNKYDVKQLLKLKIFFLSFFHTDGRLDDLRKQSPFLSITYGYKKFSIARKFALDKYSKKEGYIYLYSLNANDPYYLKTKELSKKLNKIGAKWHYDKYSEILLINGMFPHYMLGIFEVKRNKTPKFIFNPYLYEILEQDKVFDFINGLSINQQNFKQYACELGFKSYFNYNEKNKIDVNTLDDNNCKEV